MQAKGLSQEMLARSLGSTRGAIGHYLSGRRNPNLSQLETIAKSLQVHPAWLLYGLQFSEIHEDPPCYSANLQNLAKVPIIGTSVTGPGKITKAYLNLPTPTANCYALSIVGSDYSPRMYEGEAILIDPDLKPAPGDEVIVKHRNTTGVKLYSLVNIQGQNITFNNLTGKQERMIVAENQIKFMHRLIAIVRSNVAEKPATND